MTESQWPHPDRIPKEQPSATPAPQVSPDLNSQSRSSRGPYLLAALAALAAVVAATVALTNRSTPAPLLPSVGTPSTVTVTHSDVAASPTAAAPTTHRVGAGESLTAGNTYCTVTDSAIMCDVSGLTLGSPISSCSGSRRFPRYATAPSETWAQWSALPGVDVCMVQTHQAHASTSYSMAPGESVNVNVGDYTLDCSRGTSMSVMACHDTNNADDWFQVGPQEFAANH